MSTPTPSLPDRLTEIEVDPSEYPETVTRAEEYPAIQSLVIEGPPGTGKTEEGARRVAALTKCYGYDVEDICWTTYRRSLAEDILYRLFSKGVLTSNDLETFSQGRTRWMGTVHAAITRHHSDVFSARRPVNEKDKAHFMSEVYNTVYKTSERDSTPSRGEAAFDVLYWLRKNQREMTEARTACTEQYQTLCEGWPSHPTIQSFSLAWKEYKAEHELYDFHELLQYALAVESRPPCPVIIIDEFHDCYPLMNAVARQWLDDAEVGIVLGDSKQVVNSHDGATPRFFEELRDSKGFETFQLPRTYRVPRPHWAVAAETLSAQYTPPIPEFETVDGEVIDKKSPPIEENNVNGWWTEPSHEYSASTLAQEYADDGTMMVLARTQKQLKGIAATLDQAGVVYRGQIGGWRDDHVTRNVYNGLQRVRGLSPIYGSWSEPTTFEWSAWAAGDSACDTTRATPTHILGSEVYELVRHTAEEYLTEPFEEMPDIHDLRIEDDCIYPISVLTRAVTDEWWEVYGRGPESATHLVHRDELRDTADVGMVTAALSTNDGPLTTLENPSKEGVQPADVQTDSDGLENAPVLRTLHASKGSEARTVILYDGITSTIEKGKHTNPRKAQNEARTWYVGCTRSSHRMIILRDAFSWTSQYLPYGAENIAARGVAATDGGEGQ